MEDMLMNESSEAEAVIQSPYQEIGQRLASGEQLSDADVDTIADVAVGVLREILSYFSIDDVAIDEFEGDEGELILDISASDIAVLIGRHGRTLDSLQTMFSLLVSRKLGFRYPISVDIEGYKSRRKDKVMGMATNAAKRALKQGKSVSLPPMTPYERRLVHIALRNMDHIETHSEGDAQERHVVITVR